MAFTEIKNMLKVIPITWKKSIIPVSKLPITKKKDTKDFDKLCNLPAWLLPLWSVHSFWTFASLFWILSNLLARLLSGGANNSGTWSAVVVISK
ncbi:unnamed protein product [Cunninghamella blakesleeana]